MSVIIVLVCAVFAVLAALVYRQKKSQGPLVNVSAQPLPQTGWVSRYLFDKKLLGRMQGGRFSRRECAMLRFRFRTAETGVSEAVIDLLMQHLVDWPIQQDFVVTKVAEDGFVVLVEDIALPDDVAAVEDTLRVYLELPWGEEEGLSAEFFLASAAFPFDVEGPEELWGAVAKRLARREKIVGHQYASRPQYDLLDNGVIVLTHAEGAGMNYNGFREAFQIYQDEVAPLYPGVKFPHLGLSSGRISDADAKGARFMSSKMMVDVASAIAVVPKSAIEKHAMRMFSYYHRPPYPFRIFDDEDAAIEWLTQYVDPQYWDVKARRASA